MTKIYFIGGTSISINEKPAWLDFTTAKRKFVKVTLVTENYKGEPNYRTIRINLNNIIYYE